MSLFVGAYRAEGGRGAAPLRFDPNGDGARLGTYLPIPDASYGVSSLRHRRRYLVQETEAGRVSAFDESWRPEGSVATGGASPCFLALDAAERVLAVANYGGSVALIRLDPADGRPLEPVQVVAHSGSGPVHDRQAGPHAHWVGFSPDQRWLHAVDLGADAVFAHRFDPALGRIGEPEVAYAAPAGSGPRHLVRHPTLPCAFLVSELANTVTALAEAEVGRFRARQIVSSLPARFEGHSQAAHIALDGAGRRLYVSNRGANTLAVFAVDEGGGLSLMQQIPCGGDWPRLFLLLETVDRLLVANERSGEVAVFRRLADGRLRDTGRRIAIPGVVFLGA